MILLEYPWEKDYIAAILETDDGKLANLIATAQSTMLARVDELNRTRGGTIEEREDLALALGGFAQDESRAVGRFLDSVKRA